MIDSNVRKYVPDKWKLFKVDTHDGPLFKVLAGWSGGYLDSDHWRINSGITRIEEDATHYYFYGHTDSVYVCSKKGEGFTKLTASVWSGLIEHHPEKISFVSVNEIKQELNG